MHERRPLSVLIIIPVIIGFGVYAFTGQRVAPPDAAPPQTPDTQATGSASAEATPSSPPMSPPPGEVSESPMSAPVPGPAPTQPPPPTPVTTHGVFHDRAWVRVNAGAGDCLNARSQPSLSEEYAIVKECVPDGYEGVIAGPAHEWDGHWWWALAGSGYVAEDFLTYVGEADLRGPLARGETLPTGATGTIAFVRDPEIRTIDLDSGNEAVVAQLQRIQNGNGYSYTMYPTDLAWSPDRTMLSYNIARKADDPAQPWPVDLHIIRRDGSEVRIVRGVAGRGWSPDGARIGIVIGATQQEMGGGWDGAPALLNIATGDVERLDAEEFYQDDPPSFNHDGTLVLMSRSGQETAADGTVTSVWSFVVADLAGNVVARIAHPEDVYYGTPLWSPARDQIAFYEGSTDAPGYAVYDLAAGSIVARAALPERSPSAGGKCGSADMFRTSWSADGRTLYYAAMDRVSRMNGVWAWDIAGGGKRLVPTSYVVAPSAGPGALVVFGADGYIFIGDAATGRRVLVTDGGLPVWGR